MQNSTEMDLFSSLKKTVIVNESFCSGKSTSFLNVTISLLALLNTFHIPVFCYIAKWVLGGRGGGEKREIQVFWCKMERKWVWLEKLLRLLMQHDTPSAQEKKIDGYEREKQ